jgi:hypothetical protein
LTAINVLPLRDDVAYLFSDGASYDLEGKLLSVGNKTHILSSLSAAMLFSGRAIVSSYIVHHLQHQARDFDHLMEIMPDRLEEMVDHLTELFGVDASPAAKGAPQGFRAFVAGFSERRRRTVAFSISSVEDDAGREPYAIHEAPGGFQSPGVSDEQCMLGFGGPPTVTPENIEDVALTMLELQRQKPFPDDGRFMIGGLAELVTVRRDSIQTKILKRWDEDLIGEVIKPSPVDWPAWRARRTMAAAGLIPEGLSRLQRERYEKKARKGTLRAV